MTDAVIPGLDRANHVAGGEPFLAPTADPQSETGSETNQRSDATTEDPGVVQTKNDIREGAVTPETGRFVE